MDSILAYLTTIISFFLMCPVFYVFAAILVPKFRSHQRVAVLPLQSEEVVDDNNDCKMKAAKVEVAAPSSSNGTTNNKDILSNAVSITGQYLRFIMAYLAIDWLYIKCLHVFVRNMYQQHCNFLDEDHTSDMVIASPADIIANTTAHPAEQDPEEQLTIDKDQSKLSLMREEVAMFQVPNLPWVMSLNDDQEANTQRADERKLEKETWKIVEQDFPSYVTMIKIVQMESVEGSNGLIVYAVCFCFSWILPCQIYMSKRGEELWRVVFKSYYILGLLSLGMWPEFVVNDFDLFNRYNYFLELQQQV